MARLVFGMNQSLDGHVRHFSEEAEGQAGSHG